MAVDDRLSRHYVLTMAIPLKADARARPSAATPAGMLSSYREFAPSDSRTAAVIACTWEGHAGWAHSLRLLPDGCVDLVWDGASLVAFGPAPVALRSRLRAESRNVGLRLACGAAGAILGTPIDSLRGRARALHDAWGPLFRHGEAQLARASGPAEQRAALERLVIDRLDDGHRPDPCVVRAAGRLSARTTSVGDIAEASGLATRELHRRFVHHVGYGPKALHRVLRFGGFIRRLAAVASGKVTLGSLAVDLGYADQAHLCRECRQIAGSSPGALLRTWRR